MFGLQRSPGRVVFGRGQRLSVGPLAHAYGSRALVCTDKRLSGDATFRHLLDNLRASDVTPLVFDGTIAELPAACIEQCADIARGFSPDVIIGIGGGSCLDLAKLTALLLTHGGRLSDYYGEALVPGPVLPVIAVPTTSGTGSEVTPVAVLGDPERTLKVGISSMHLIPSLAICDPDLTTTCPPALTAIAGADALTHAIEAFTAVTRTRTSTLAHERVFVGKNVLSDQHARAAMSALGRGLARAVADGSDAEARDLVMLGALEAGLAFGTAGTAAAHAVQYPVGAFTGTAHGLGVAAMLPYVMEWNRPACTTEFAEVTVLLGAGTASEPQSVLADRAADTVAALFRTIGIPETLADLGLPEGKISWTAEQALSIGRLVGNNPRALDPASMETLVRSAFSGNREALRSLEPAVVGRFA